MSPRDGVTVEGCEDIVDYKEGVKEALGCLFSFIMDRSNCPDDHELTQNHQLTQCQGSTSWFLRFGYQRREADYSIRRMKTGTLGAGSRRQMGVPVFIHPF